jgi:hypothetical protein
LQVYDAYRLEKLYEGDVDIKTSDLEGIELVVNSIFVSLQKKETSECRTLFTIDFDSFVIFKMFKTSPEWE